MSTIIVSIIIILFVCIEVYRDNKKEKKRAEETRKRIRELMINDELIDLLVGYRDNRVAFNLASLINLFDERKVKYNIISVGTVNITINVWRDEYKFFIICNKTNNINEVKISSIKKYSSSDI